MNADLTIQWSTLDHVTNGRCAWNVVTSYSNSAAKAMGHEEVMSHDERYEGKTPSHQSYLLWI